MTKVTKAQAQAILRIFNRGKDWARDMPTCYRDLRRRVMPTFYCDGAIVLPVAGMMLCIEQDGYTHS